MSNVFRGSGITYFQVPNYLVISGLLFELRPSAKDLYLILLHQAQRITKAEFTLTNDDLTTYGRISANSIAQARTELAEHGFIRYDRVLGGAYHYVLCDPEKQQPLADPRHRNDAGGSPVTVGVKTATKPAGSRKFGPAFRDWVAALTETDKRRYFEARLSG